MARIHKSWLLFAIVFVGSLSLVSAIRAEGTPPDPFARGFATAAADPAHLVVELKPGDAVGAYAGQIHFGEKLFPLTAHADPKDPGRLQGSFESGGNQFEFTAVLADDRLTLTSGNAVYVLHPRPANPLAAGGDAPRGAPAAPVTSAAAAVVLRPQELFDQQMNMNAMSLLVPDGWKFDYRIYWVTQADGLALSDVTVFDPATRAVGRIYPDFQFIDGVREEAIRNDPTRGGMRRSIEADNAEGKRYAGVGSEIRHQPATPLQYLQQIFIPRLRQDLANAKDIKLISEKDLPDYAKTVAASSGANARGRTSRIRISYTAPATEKSGAELVEEEFVCTLVSIPLGVPGSSIITWSGRVDSYRAPAGKLDALMPTFGVIRGSLQTDLPWFNLYHQIANMLLTAEREKTMQMGADTAARMAILHDYARQASADVSQRIHDNFDNQQKAKAESHASFMNYVNNVQAYRNPGNGSTVTLPSGYQYAYMSNNGGIIYTNDAGYQPPADPKTSWQRLEPTK